MSRLFVTRGKRLFAIHPIEGTLMIGRGGSANVRVNDQRVSRIHAAIISENGTVYLRDLDSRNGTLVNGIPVSDVVQLHHKDEIRVADWNLYVGEPPVSIKKRYLASKPPERVGRYDIIEMLGRGGMGEVYKARDTENDAVVALKIIRKALAGTEDYIKRFHDREAKLVRQLSHPNIVEIHEDSIADGYHYLAMEYVGGGSLAERMKSGPMPVAEVLEIIKQTASGLRAAHERNIVHRDIKPLNILLGQQSEGAAGSGKRDPLDVSRSQQDDDPADLDHHSTDASAADLARVNLSDAGAKEDTAVLPEAPIVGRSTELEHLAGAFNAARKGRTPFVLVRGERGIGKTRLGSEFTRRKLKDGYGVYEAEPNPAHYANATHDTGSFNPFASIAEKLLEEVQSKHIDLPKDTLEQWVRQLSPILPRDDLRRRHGASGQASCNAGKAADALCDLWAMVEPDGHFIVVLDDLQRLDEIACRMLEHVARIAASERFLICGMLRENSHPAESGHDAANPSLRAALVPLARAGLLVEMYVKPLTRFGTGKLIEGLLGNRESADKIIDNLFRISKGIPGTIRRILASLARQGRLVKSSDGFALNQQTSQGVDEALSRTLMKRYDALPTPVKEVFRICALVERDFNFAVIQPIARHGANRLFFALNHLVSEGLLLVSERNGDNFYSVANDELCRRAGREIAHKDRVRLYNGLAASIERAFPQRDVGVLERMAHLYGHGGDNARAVRCLLVAADSARKELGAAAARPYLRSILKLMRSTDSDVEQQRKIAAELRSTFGSVEHWQEYIGRQIGVLGSSYVKVADFGVALAAQEATDHDLARTQGTARYMAPEQILGEALDGRSDIFSLGVVAFEMLTGRTTFEVAERSDFFNFNCSEDIPPPNEVEPSIPQDVASIVRRMTDRRRNKRHTADELIREIERVQVAMRTTEH